MNLYVSHPLFHLCHNLLLHRLLLLFSFYQIVDISRTAREFTSTSGIANLAMNFFVYLAFNKDFREALLKRKFCCLKQYQDRNEIAVIDIRSNNQTNSHNQSNDRQVRNQVAETDISKTNVAEDSNNQIERNENQVDIPYVENNIPSMLDIEVQVHDENQRNENQNKNAVAEIKSIRPNIENDSHNQNQCDE